MLGKEKFLQARAIKPDPLFGVGWFYPNTYSVGMAGLGYQLVWSVLEQDPQVSVHRGFSDQQEVDCESSELFGFTVAWELDFINIFEILSRNGVPVSSQDRQLDDAIVFGGGPVLSANPEPFCDIFDVVLLGDAEATVPVLLEAWKKARHLRTRKERLIELAQHAGVYVPSLYEVQYHDGAGPIRSIAPMNDNVPPHPSKQLFMPPSDYVAHTKIISPDTTWGDMFLVEVVRSCPQECRFCLASFLTRPFRATNVDTLIDAIELGLKHTKNIGLLGPSITEHPQFDSIADKIRQYDDARISIASVRADSLNENILTTLRKLGQKSVTIAIESGSERLRQVMKKNLSESEIHHAVDLIAQAGFEGVKFYGIVGLPHETQEDLEETVRLLRDLKKKHRRLRFVFGVSTFVPKAQTPFQWHGRDHQCVKKLEYVRSRLAKAGIDVRPESHNWSDIQALLSRGDRRLWPLLREVYQGGSKLGSWKKGLRNLPEECPGLDYFAFRTIPADEILPWSHLVDSEKTAYLAKHDALAKSVALSSTT